MGIVVYAISERLRTVPFTKLGRKALSVCACMGYLGVLVTAFLISWGAMDYVWLLCIAGAVAITGSEAGSLCQWLNTLNPKVFSFLGTYSMALYMTHLICQHIVNYWLSSWPVERRIALFGIASMALALLCVLCIRCVRVLGNKYSLKVKRLFVEKEK